MTRAGNNSRLRLAIAMLAVAWASSAQAFSTGIATTSFPVPAQACNFCHGGGLIPTVMLECVDCGGGPPVVAPLSTHEFKFTVVEIGLQNHAGLNVSSPLGTLATGGGFSANTQTLTGTGGRQEVTHTAPKAAAGGVTEFTFLWTSPASGSATLTAWGNAVNFTGTTAGDAAGTTSLIVTISGDTPTPTVTPTATPEPPTPTPTPLGGCPTTVDASWSWKRGPTERSGYPSHRATGASPRSASATSIRRESDSTTAGLPTTARSSSSRTLVPTSSSIPPAVHR